MEDLENWNPSWTPYKTSLQKFKNISSQAQQENWRH